MSSLFPWPERLLVAAFTISSGVSLELSPGLQDCRGLGSADPGQQGGVLRTVSVCIRVVFLKTAQVTFSDAI